MTPTSMSMNEIDHCSELCAACARTCVATLYRHCLTVGGRHVAAPHVQLMTDCSEICTVAANFMIRGSTRHSQICAVCADICQACADDCANLEDMDDCVSACRLCADACRAMAT